MARNPGTPETMDYRRILGAIAFAGAVALLCGTRGRAPEPQFPALKLDPNVAPREVLAALPMLGPARVAAIEAARADAPFRSAEDLDRRVKGIGPATIAELRPFLRFDTTPALHP